MHHKEESCAVPKKRLHCLAHTLHCDGLQSKLTHFEVRVTPWPAVGVQFALGQLPRHLAVLREAAGGRLIEDSHHWSLRKLFRSDPDTS